MTLVLLGTLLFVLAPVGQAAPCSHGIVFGQPYVAAIAQMGLAIRQADSQADPALETCARPDTRPIADFARGIDLAPGDAVAVDFDAQPTCSRLLRGRVQLPLLCSRIEHPPC